MLSLTHKVLPEVLDMFHDGSLGIHEPLACLFVEWIGEGALAHQREGKRCSDVRNSALPILFRQ